MSSDNDWIDELAARLTPADTEAMSRSREATHRMTWSEYMEFLSANSHLAKVSRKTHAGFEPFKL